jgi:CO dehydrogenase maturation factor
MQDTCRHLRTHRRRRAGRNAEEIGQKIGHVCDVHLLLHVTIRVSFFGTRWRRTRRNSEQVGQEVAHIGNVHFVQNITVGVAPRERIESRIWEQGLWEGESFDFLAIGTKWVEGCYCLPDAALKGALGAITRNYRYVLIDAPAGLEHLNRRVTASIDDLFEVLGPSRKSFAHVDRAYRVAREVGISFTRFLGVGGYLFTGDLEAEATRIPHLSYLGRVPRDPAVAALGLAGGSLLDLPDGSPAVAAVREILARAGYPFR